MEKGERKSMTTHEEKPRAIFFLFFFDLFRPPSQPRCPLKKKKKQESTIGAAFLTKSMPDHGVKFEIW